MFAATAFSALLAVAAPLFVSADVTPTEPGPGDVFKIGKTCNVKWAGDSDSTTAWKNMNIELMTGSDLGQVHITTVATGQDGTVDGTFQYTCPEVTPTSAVYFYQLTAPNTTSVTWTTRFTIASSTGATTPPPNATQPRSDKPVPWGIGALVDPSKAVAGPVPGTGSTVNSTASGSSNPASGSTNPSSSSSVAKGTSNFSSTQSLAVSATGSTSDTSSSARRASAASSLGFDNMVWFSVGAHVLTAFMVF